MAWMEFQGLIVCTIWQSEGKVVVRSDHRRRTQDLSLGQKSDQGIGIRNIKFNNKL